MPRPHRSSGNRGRRGSLADFTPSAFEDPRRRALAARVEVVQDAVCDDEFPHAFSAVLRVTTHDGVHVEHRVPGSRGGPAAPLTLEELEAKYRLGADPVLGADRTERLAVRTRALPRAGKGCARRLLDGCRPEDPEPSDD
ncbi:hypothetical protein ACIQM0_37635 [Streptomyces sp. NPDC091387]|uniref:hypothetical protein n=1 Tax=Streptomyces sp. NPDC091387 TaxID=3365998 RepID=UPI00381BF2F5